MNISEQKGSSLPMQSAAAKPAPTAQSPGDNGSSGVPSASEHVHHEANDGRLRELRAALSQALERARAEEIIKNNLEATVTLQLADAEWLDQCRPFLAEFERIFILSELHLEPGPDDAVTVAKAGFGDPKAPSSTARIALSLANPEQNQEKNSVAAPTSPERIDQKEAAPSALSATRPGAVTTQAAPPIRSHAPDGAQKPVANPDAATAPGNNAPAPATASAQTSAPSEPKKAPTTAAPTPTPAPAAAVPVPASAASAPQAQKPATPAASANKPPVPAPAQPPAPTGPKPASAASPAKPAAGAPAPNPPAQSAAAKTAVAAPAKATPNTKPANTPAPGQAAAAKVPSPSSAKPAPAAAPTPEKKAPSPAPKAVEKPNPPAASPPAGKAPEPKAPGTPPQASQATATEAAGPPAASPAAQPDPAPDNDSKATETIDGRAELVTADRGKASKPRGIAVLFLRALGRTPPDSEQRALARREPTAITPTIDAPPPPRRPGLLRRHALFIFSVLLPTALAAWYFLSYATDIYVSESRFVVRTPNQQTSGGLGSVLQGTGLGGFGRAQDDVYTVSQYVLSRDALDVLDGKLDLRPVWGAETIDVVRRFDPFGWDNSREALFEYYPRRVGVAVEPSSGITTLTVSVFSPEQAREINQILLGEAERLVNVLNDRARNDLIRFAENEVKIAEERAKEAALAVSEYRNTEAVVDPEKQTELHFEHISRLQEELMRAESQLVQLRVFAPESPHPPSLEVRIRTLQNEIEKEMEKITGGENSLASKAAEYERLALEREFAERQLQGALTALEMARNEAQRQQLYLETIAKPSLPDGPLYPRRFRGIVATLVLGIVAWGILSMLLTGVREHQY